jgi:ferric-dicitrate binding protein FerR (iron transport regulator)
MISIGPVGQRLGQAGKTLLQGDIVTSPKEKAMATESRIRIVFASAFGCLLLLLPGIPGAGEQQLGRILYSSSASLRGVPVPKSETIFSGDVLTTSGNGSALVELKSGAKVKITENTSVRFLRDGEKVQAELLSGVVVSESAGKPAIVVTTPKYRFMPSQEGNCRYLVRLSKEQETIAAAVKGNLLIDAHGSTGRYILPEGKYAAIPASAEGVPPQEEAGGGQMPAGQAGTVTNAIPEEAVQRLGKGEWAPLKVSDAIDWADVVSTSKGGRVRIALLGGSFLNVGAHSVMKVTRHEPQTQQTQVELNEGRLRAEVVELTEPNAVFQVETQTAKIGVVSGVANTVFLVEADPKETRVDCVRGLVTVGNPKPTVTERVRLHPGQFAIVPAGQHPTLPNEVSPGQLQGRIDQTDVGDSTIRAAVPGKPGATVKAPWHIGSLSPGASIGLLAGGAAAVAAIPLAAGGGGSVSPTVP